MIKILFIHHQLVCGGAEQALYDLVCLMDKTKFDITVLVQMEGGMWEQKFRDAGINVIHYHSCQQKSSLPWVKARNYIKRRQLAAALRKDGEGLIEKCFPENYDIVVSYFVWKWMRIGVQKKAKTVYYIHEDAATNASLRDRLTKHRDLLASFDQIVRVSKTAANSFSNATGQTERISAFFNPINSNNIRQLSTEDPQLPYDLPIICAVGRLAPEKGFDRLIFIHKRLVDRGLLHRLVIVGDGGEKTHLQTIVRGLKAEKTVLLTGYSSNPSQYMKRSRFLVCSSYTEGLPVIAMEALSLGVPIVSSFPSIAELFGESPCGIVTESDDESLEAGIEKMLVDHSFYAQAKAAAEHRSLFFDGKRMVKDVEQMFIGLLDKD